MAKEDVDRELTNLKPELQDIVKGIYRDIIVYHRLPIDMFEGKRNMERQEWLVKQGYSKTLNSRHLDGSAVDFVVCIDGKWSWADHHLHYFKFLGGKVKELYGNKIEWGGDWITFLDLPHYQLKK